MINLIANGTTSGYFGNLRKYCVFRINDENVLVLQGWGSDGNGSNQYTFEFPDCYVLPDEVNEEHFLSHNAPLFMLKKFDGDMDAITKQIGMWCKSNKDSKWKYWLMKIHDAFHDLC